MTVGRLTSSFLAMAVREMGLSRRMISKIAERLISRIAEAVIVSGYFIESSMSVRLTHYLHEVRLIYTMLIS